MFAFEISKKWAQSFMLPFSLEVQQFYSDAFCSFMHLAGVFIFKCKKAHFIHRLLSEHVSVLAQMASINPIDCSCGPNIVCKIVPLSPFCVTRLLFFSMFFYLCSNCSKKTHFKPVLLLYNLVIFF